MTEQSAPQVPGVRRSSLLRPPRQKGPLQERINPPVERSGAAATPAAPATPSAPSGQAPPSGETPRAVATLIPS